jgi:hypothetical protein
MKLKLAFLFIVLSFIYINSSFADEITKYRFRQILWKEDLSKNKNMILLYKDPGPEYETDTWPVSWSYIADFYKRKDEQLKFYNIPINDIWYINEQRHTSGMKDVNGAAEHVIEYFQEFKKAYIFVNKQSDFELIKTQLSMLNAKKLKCFILTKFDEQSEDHKGMIIISKTPLFENSEWTNIRHYEKKIIESLNQK